METNKPGESDVIIQKLPSDMGIHRNPRKGTLSAPDEILEGLDFEEKIFIEELFPDEFDLEETQLRIEECSRELAGYGKPLVSVGGDHSVSFPVLKALKEAFPELKLVWLDAHLDLKEKVEDHVSHDVVVRELFENGFEEDEVKFVGTTKIDGDEEEFLSEKDIEIRKASELSEFDLDDIGFEEGPVYMSIDIDVLKKEEAPGTGYRDGKMSTEQALNIIDLFDPDHGDIVEVAPPLDRDGITVKNSRRLLDRLLENVS